MVLFWHYFRPFESGSGCKSLLDALNINTPGERCSESKKPADENLTTPAAHSGELTRHELEDVQGRGEIKKEELLDSMQYYADKARNLASNAQMFVFPSSEKELCELLEKTAAPQTRGAGKSFVGV